MPRQEFIDLVERIKKTGNGEKMSKRDFISLFDWYEKRTSVNFWRINEYLQKEKMIVVPNYQKGWIDELIELKGKDKAKIKKGNGDDQIDEFDPINRLSVLKVASQTPISISRDASLEKAYHLMWKNDFSQLPIMNGEREVLGVISWQTIAKGLIAKKPLTTVKDFMTNDFIVLDEDTPLFDAIKQVIKKGVVFVSNKENKIKGPVTTSDLNEQFIEQIEPYILLEQIENYIRLILHDKIILEEILKLLTIEENDRELTSISDMTFGEYLRIFENNDMWKLLLLPFDRADFVKDLDEIRKIRNGVMHFHPDSISSNELKLLRRMSNFLMDFLKNTQ